MAGRVEDLRGFLAEGILGPLAFQIASIDSLHHAGLFSTLWALGGTLNIEGRTL